MSWTPPQPRRRPDADEQLRTPTDEIAGLPRPGEAPVRLGKYELLAKIGSGGMATVHIARQRGLCQFEKAVVVKTIRPQFAEEQKFIDMFVDEARISALLKHPNCVDVYDVGCDDGTYFIAMEHLSGQALKELLKAGLRGNPLDITSAVKIVADAAEALHAAHNLCTMNGEHLELVHRDVSPANIMVTYDGRVKLLDFGISKARGRISQTVTQTLKGKLGYMAPEVIQHESIDRRADIFALGVVMWESLVLRPLFRGGNEGATLLKVMQCNPTPPSHLRPGVSPALDAICLRALARDPNERYQTAEQMQQDILSYLGGEASFSRNKISAYMNQTFADRRAREERMLRGVAADGRAPTFPPNGAFAHGSQSEWSSDDPDEIRSRLPLRAEETAYGGPAARVKSATVARPHAERAASVIEDLLDDHSVEDIYAEQGESREFADLDVTIDETRARLRVGALVAVALVVVAIAAAALGLDPMGPAEPPQPSAAEATVPEGARAAKPAASPAEPGDRSSLVVSGIEERAPARGDDGAMANDDDSEMTFEPEAASPPARPKARARSQQSRRRVARREKAAPAADARVNDPAKARTHYADGQRAFFRGDLGGAREEFLAAVRASRGFAPAYRGLGLVFERQGKKRSARRAFERYLRLAPRASDASSIRTRLDKL